jgi:hypothetical protein
MDGRLIIGNARIEAKEKIKAALGLLRSWGLVRSTTSIRSLGKIAGRFFR